MKLWEINDTKALEEGKVTDTIKGWFTKSEHIPMLFQDMHKRILAYLKSLPKSKLGHKLPEDIATNFEHYIGYTIGIVGDAEWESVKTMFKMENPEKFTKGNMFAISLKDVTISNNIRYLIKHFFKTEFDAKMVYQKKRNDLRGRWLFVFTNPKNLEVKR